MISSNKTGIFSNLKYNNEYVFKNIKFSEPLKNKFLDSSITLNVRLNEYYLNLNYNTVSEEINTNKVCSIDPGMKTFLTVYSDMSVVKLGNNINTKIGKICYETDIINSKISDKNRSSNSRRNLRKALHRKIKYVENLKEELHNKCIRFLINNYSVIILPMTGKNYATTLGATLSGSVQYADAVLGPNGKIYAVPADATKLLTITMNGLNNIGNWMYAPEFNKY